MPESPKTCLKCGHTRTPADRATRPYACPRCEAVYSKVELVRRATALADTVPAGLPPPLDTQPLGLVSDARMRVSAPQPVPVSRDGLQRALVHAIYLTLALGLLLPVFLPAVLAPVLGVSLAYQRRSVGPPAWIAAHHGWQIRTFWIGLLGTATVLILAALLGAFEVGGISMLHTSTLLMGYRGSYVVLGLALVTALLVSARVARGWAALWRRRPVGAGRQGTGLYGPPASSARR